MLPVALLQEVMMWLPDFIIVRHRTLCRNWYAAMITVQKYTRRIDGDRVPCSYAEHSGVQGMLTLANVSRVPLWTEYDKLVQMRTILTRTPHPILSALLRIIAQSFPVPRSIDLHRKLVLLGLLRRYVHHNLSLRGWPADNVLYCSQEVIDAVANGDPEWVEMLLNNTASDDPMVDICTGLAQRPMPVTLDLANLPEKSPWVGLLVEHRLEGILCQAIRKMWTTARPHIMRDGNTVVPDWRTAIGPLSTPKWMDDFSRCANRLYKRMPRDFISVVALVMEIIAELDEIIMIIEVRKEPRYRETYGLQCRGSILLFITS